MEKYIIGGICALSALAGLGLGYLVLGPIQASAMANREVYVPYGIVETAVPELLTPEPEATDVPSLEFEPEQEYTHQYLVTTSNGYIVIYNMASHDKAQTREITTTTITSLPPEEQARLQDGIRIYTEEALVRILQDYGS